MQPQTDVGARACRTGGSSATQTISSSSCTAPEATSRPCARTSPTCSPPMGLRLSRRPRPRCVHMSDGFDFLGFHIQWRRKTRNEQVARLHLHRRPARPVVEGEDPCPDPQDVAAGPRGRADPAQPDHARLGQLLPARRRPSTPSATLAPVRVVAGRPVADDAAPLEVDGRPPTISPTPTGRWQPISGGRDRAVQPRSGAGHPIPLPGQHDPQPLDPANHANGRNRGEPVALKGARRVRRAAWGNGPVSNTDTAPQADSTRAGGGAVRGREVPDPGAGPLGAGRCR